MGLEFLHPHIQTKINDNSFIYEEAINNSTILFQPYLSDMGQCSTVVKYTSLNDFINKNGTPNFRKHGQSIYNIVNWLKSGGIVYGYRVTADDATYSNIIVNIKAKTGDDGRLDTKLELVPAKNITDISMFDNVLTNTEIFPADDSEGYTNHPIFCLHVNGKGEFGNQYRIGLKQNISQQSKYEFRTYELTVKKKERTGLKSVEGPFIVSLHPDSYDVNGTSMFIKQIIENYSSVLSIKYNDTAYFSLMAKIEETLASNKKQPRLAAMTTKELDYLFWKSLEKEEPSGTYKSYDFVNCLTENFEVDNLEGKSLVEGSEGSFAINKSDRQTLIDTKIGKIFSGEILPGIKNKKLYPFEVILDANYPVKVKSEIASLANERCDFIGFLDCGFQASVEKALTWKKENNINFNNFYIASFPQTFTVEDPYTTSDIPVTMPYFLASMIPSHDDKYGVQFPIAGPSRGIVSGFKANSLNFNPDEYQQEDLYVERLNYIVQDLDGTELYTNLTSQVKTSALSNINNVRVLIKIIKQVEKRAKNYRHEFSDDHTLSNFKADLSIIESEWVNNRACTELVITPYQDAYDIQQKTCRVAINIVFNGTIERIIIEVNVGN